MNGEFINLDTAKKIQEDKNMDKDLLKIIEHYGAKDQIIILIEEMDELSKVLCKWYREYNKLEGDISEELLNNFKEKMSDVLIMLMQFKEYYHMDGNDIMKIMREKIDRQLGRIENESK